MPRAKSAARLAASLPAVRPFEEDRRRLRLAERAHRRAAEAEPVLRLEFRGLADADDHQTLEIRPFRRQDIERRHRLGFEIGGGRRPANEVVDAERPRLGAEPEVGAGQGDNRRGQFLPGPGKGDFGKFGHGFRDTSFDQRRPPVGRVRHCSCPLPRGKPDSPRFSFAISRIVPVARPARCLIIAKAPVPAALAYEDA